MLRLAAKYPLDEAQLAEALLKWCRNQGVPFIISFLLPIKYKIRKISA
jgi:hypothetical protein